MLLVQPTELFGVFDLRGKRQHRRVVIVLNRKWSVAHRLVGSFDVVVALYEFIDQVLKMILAEDDGCKTAPETTLSQTIKTLSDSLRLLTRLYLFPLIKL